MADFRFVAKRTVAILSVLLIIFCSIFCNPNVASGDGRKSVLIFGGNGFIGAATVEKLLRRNANIVLVNRGNWYWDSDTRVKPFVKTLKCDRMQSLQKCSELQMFLWNDNSPKYFDAIVDFSAYHGFEITEATDTLKGRIKMYIYISSDSVYEVCLKNHTELTREEDAVRPGSAEEREKLKQKDNYGHRKLDGEEELQLQSKNEGFPYISLRLPDVIGPRDNTYRWWIYQLWIKLWEYLDRNLSVPFTYWAQPISFVYMDDVAAVIDDIIHDIKDPLIENQAFNLAQEEIMTLSEYLESLMKELKTYPHVNIISDENEDALFLFPSVKSGPIDTQKAKKLLNWTPTPWNDVLQTTVKFYESAMTNERFLKARNDVITTIQTHFSKDPVKVLRGLRDIYGVDYLTQKEEL